VAIGFSRLQPSWREWLPEATHPLLGCSSRSRTFLTVSWSVDSVAGFGSIADGTLFRVHGNDDKGHAVVVPVFSKLLHEIVAACAWHVPINEDHIVVDGAHPIGGVACGWGLVHVGEAHMLERPIHLRAHDKMVINDKCLRNSPVVAASF